MPLPLYSLAVARLGIGIATLIAPLNTAAFFYLPSARTSAVGLRLFGSREVAVGGLLLYALGNFEQGLGRQGSGADVLKAAVVTGIVVDGIDVLSCLACYADGSVQSKGAALFGGGAVLFVSLGAWGLSVFN